MKNLIVDENQGELTLLPLGRHGGDGGGLDWWDIPVGQGRRLWEVQADGQPTLLAEFRPNPGDLYWQAVPGMEKSLRRALRQIRNAADAELQGRRATLSLTPEALALHGGALSLSALTVLKAWTVWMLGRGDDDDLAWRICHTAQEGVAGRRQALGMLRAALETADVSFGRLEEDRLSVPLAVYPLDARRCFLMFEGQEEEPGESVSVAVSQLVDGALYAARGGVYWLNRQTPLLSYEPGVMRPLRLDNFEGQGECAGCFSLQPINSVGFCTACMTDEDEAQVAEALTIPS